MQIGHLLKTTLKRDMFRKRQLKNREIIRSKQRMVTRFLGSNAFVNGPTMAGVSVHEQVSQNPDDVEARLWEMIKIRDAMRRLERKQGYRKPSACRTPYSFEDVDPKTGKVVLQKADAEWFSDQFSILGSETYASKSQKNVTPISALDAGDQGLSLSVAHCGVLEEVGGFANPQGLAHLEDIRIFHDLSTTAHNAYELDFYAGDSPTRDRSSKEAVLAGQTKLYSLSGGSRQTQAYLDEFYANKYLDVEEWGQWYDQVAINDGFVDVKKIAAAAMKWNGGQPYAGEIATAASSDFFGCLLCGSGSGGGEERFPCYECQTNCATCRGVKHAPNLHSLEKGLGLLNEMSIQKKKLWMPVLLEMQDELEMQVRKAREDYKLKEEAEAMALPTMTGGGKVKTVGAAGVGSQVRILVSSKTSADEQTSLKNRYEKGAKLYLRNRALAFGPPRGKLVLQKMLEAAPIAMGLKFDGENSDQAVLYPIEEDAANLVPGLLGAELERLSNVADARGVEVKLLEGPPKPGAAGDGAVGHAPTTRGQRDLVRLASSSIRGVVTKAVTQMKAAKPKEPTANGLSFLDQNFTDFGDIILQSRFISAFKKLIEEQNGEMIAERIVVPVRTSMLSDRGAAVIDNSIYSAFLYKTVRIPLATKLLGGVKKLRNHVVAGCTAVDNIMFPRSWAPLQAAKERADRTVFALVDFVEPLPDTECADFLFSSAQKTPVFDIFNTLKINTINAAGKKQEVYAGRLADPEVWTSVFRDFIRSQGTNGGTKFNANDLVDRAEKLG